MHNAKQIRLLDLWLQLSEHAGWWQPYEGVVMACEPLAKQAIDEQGRLHSEDGPAAIWRDGWEVFVWHGVRVPEDVIMKPQAITTEDILREMNAELRRVKMFRYGLDRLLGQMTKEQDDGYGELYSFNGPAGLEKFVRVVNGTPESNGTYNDYIIPTWPDVKSAHEAVARSYGREVGEYAPEVRT